MFSDQFYRDLSAWKKARPEYTKFVKAIKAGKPNEELADDAGCTTNEVIELQNLHRRASAPAMQERAARFQKVEKELDALNVKVAETDKAMSTSKTQLQRDELEGELYDLIERRQKMQLALADSQAAAGCVSAARSAGVL